MCTRAVSVARYDIQVRQGRAILDLRSQTRREGLAPKNVAPCSFAPGGVGGGRLRYDTRCPRTRIQRKTGKRATSLWASYYTFYCQSYRISATFRGPTPEWVGWTVTGPSPAEGFFIMARGFVSG